MTAARVPVTRRLRNLLLTGLFIVAPFSLTFILIAWFVTLIDRALAPVVGLVGKPLPGLGLAVAFVLILLAGALGSNIAGRHLLEFFEEFLLRIPGFSWVYRTVKQLSAAFTPGSKASFKGVVLVEYPRPSVYSLGFVTNTLALEREGSRQDLVCVYVPSNHMVFGEYVLVPAAQVIATGLTQQEGIQAVLSAGAALPPLITSRTPPGEAPAQA